MSKTQPGRDAPDFEIGKRRGARCQRWAATPLVALLLAASGCGDSDSAEGSPTGTTLLPRTGIDAEGYDVIDEVCGGTHDPAYLERFETAMFRSVAVVDNVAYLVDGSLLWAVDIEDPAQPSRLSLTRLPGHPISVFAGANEKLWIAAGEAGLHEVDVTEPNTPTLLSSTAFGAPVLDAVWDETRGYVALGSEGIAAFEMAEGAPQPQDFTPTTGFAADLALLDGRLHVAACDSVLTYGLTADAPPELLTGQSVPSGTGRAVTATDGALYVSAGSALYAYGIDSEDALHPLGSYADPDVPEFYVNDFVVRGDMGFIAAGDESVRAIDLGEIASWTPKKPSGDEPDEPQLDDAIDLPMPTVRIEYGDPISVALHGDSLLVLGNFRWVGERLLRILDASKPDELPELGQYVQPQRYGGIERGDTALWVTERGEGTLEVDENLQIVQKWESADKGRARRLGESLGYVTPSGQVFCLDEQGVSSTQVETIGEWTVVGGSLVVGLPQDNAIAWYLNDDCFSTRNRLRQDIGLIGHARLGESQDRLLAYDWVLDVLYVDKYGNLEGYEMEPCERYDWADTFSGAHEYPARFVSDPDGFALLCPSNAEEEPELRRFSLDAEGAPVPRPTLPLPAGRYSDLITFGDGWALVAFDNGRYRSSLLFIDAEGEVVDQIVYDGHVLGLAELATGIHLFDHDLGVLRYEASTGLLAPTELTSTEGEQP